jgi:hypothetical protein
LQQEGFLLANTSQSLNANPYPTPPPNPNFAAISSNRGSSPISESSSSSNSSTTPNQSVSSPSEVSPANNSISNSPSSNSKSSSQSQTSLQSNSLVSDITVSQPTSSEKPTNNSLDLPITNFKPNHELSSEPSLPKNNNNKTVLDYPNDSKNDKPENSLTLQKQQVIQQIQTEIDKMPDQINLAKEHTN